MKWTILCIIFLLSVFRCLAQDASTSNDGAILTDVTRIEIDGKAVKKPYKVLFRQNGKWIEAERTSTGFVLPNELKSEEWLSVLIAFGKYRLDFPKIHVSKFGQPWTVGIDKKPYSVEFVPPSEAATTISAYYIQFLGGHGTQLIITEKKASN